MSFFTAAHAQTAAEREAANQLLDEGYKQFQAGNMPEALSNFDMALEIDPNNSLAHFHAADIYQATGQIWKMKQSWERAATLGKGTAHGIRARLKLKKWNDAHNNFSKTSEAKRMIELLPGKWCEKGQSYYYGEDKNGRNWQSNTKRILEISKSPIVFRGFDYIINSSCIPQEELCITPKIAEIKKSFEYNCEKQKCFDINWEKRVVNNKMGGVLRLSYGMHDKYIHISVIMSDRIENIDRIDMIYFAPSRHKMNLDPNNVPSVLVGMHNLVRCN